jgi:hypothetical protein
MHGLRRGPERGDPFVYPLAALAESSTCQVLHHKAVRQGVSGSRVTDLPGAHVGMVGEDTGCTTDKGCPTGNKGSDKPEATLASTHQHYCLAVGENEKAREPPDKKVC